MSQQNILNWHVRWLIVFLLVFIIVGCQSSNEGNISEVPGAKIYVFPSGSEKRLVYEETIPIDNCSGNAEKSQTVERTETIRYEIQVGGGYSINPEGKVGIPGVGEVGIGSEIALNAGVRYGREESLSRSVFVASGPGSHQQHTVRHFEVWEQGEVLVIVGETDYQIPYELRRDFALETIDPANLGCSSSAPVASPPPSDTPKSLQGREEGSVTTRSAGLVNYDALYTQKGWCSLWEKLQTDGLITGNCPETVSDIAREDIISDNGAALNLITGVQITINSEIAVNYPACINYGIDGDYATLSNGRIRSWTENSNVATDVTVMPNSIFSLYFRCDHITWP